MTQPLVRIFNPSPNHAPYLNSYGHLVDWVGYTDKGVFARVRMLDTFELAEFRGYELSDFISAFPNNPPASVVLGTARRSG